MFDTLTGSVGAGANPTHARSVWIDTAPGVWSLNPILTGAEVPDPAEHRRLADLAPGSGLAREVEHALAETDRLDDAGLVDAIVGVERLSRWAAGVQAQWVAEFARRRPGDEPTSVSCDRIVPGSRWAPDELGLALQRTRFDTKTLIGRSLQLRHVLPDTLTALQAGTIDERRATAICESTLALPQDKARAVEATVLPAAPGRTLRQLRDRLRRAVHRVDPDGEHRRHTAAHQQRRVTIAPRDEGMASIWISASAHDAEASFASVTRLAQAMGSDDGRTLDQRRSDVAMQILQGRLTVTALADIATAVTTTTTTMTDTVETATTTTDTDAGTDTVETDTATGTETDTVQADSAETGAVEDAGSDGGNAATGAADDTTPADHPVPDRTVPDHPVPDRTDSAGAGAGASPLPEQALIVAVAAALARRPHDTTRKPLIQVVVGLDTLTGESDRPAELLGHGPLTADTARALAADALWKRLVTDPLSGALLDHGRTTYRPPAALTDFVDARDQYCRFPTCTRRVRELDHHHRYSDDGHTTDANLNGYCPTHHLLKEHQDWHVLTHPDGRLTWITPTGLRYTSDPYDYRPFTDPLPTTDTADQDPTTNPAGTADTDDPADTDDLDTDDGEDPPPF